MICRVLRDVSDELRDLWEDDRMRMVEEQGITKGRCTLISFFSFRLKHAQITFR